MGLLRTLARKVVQRMTSATTTTTTRPDVTASTRAEPPSANGDELATIDAGVQEVRERVEAGEPVTLLDVREAWECAAGMLPQARHIPLSELGQRWRELADCDEIVCYCAAGVRSVAAAQLLRANGLFNATSLDGGFAAWRDAGGPVVLPG